MFKPNFTITPEINSQIAEIEKLKTTIDQASILPELEVQLRFRATVEAVHSSTSIEGNLLNKEQVQKVLQGKTVTAPNYAIQEVLNYKNAISWLNQKEILDNVLTSNKILKLHKITMQNLLPKEKIGHWRPRSIYVVDEINGKEIVQYEGPQAKDVPRLIESFLEWVSIQSTSKKLHPILLAGLIHYIFVSIHPFPDGNGRTTRLLTYHYLKTAQYDFRDSLSLESYYLQHRNDYYKALSRGKTFELRMHANITPFLNFFIAGFLDSVQSLSHHVKAGKIFDVNKKLIRLSQEELQILDYVYQFKSITITEALDILPTTKRTIQRRLISLVEKNILNIEGKGPSTKYILATKK